MVLVRASVTAMRRSVSVMRCSRPEGLARAKCEGMAWPNGVTLNFGSMTAGGSPWLRGAAAPLAAAFSGADGSMATFGDRFKSLPIAWLRFIVVVLVDRQAVSVPYWGAAS